MALASPSQPGGPESKSAGDPNLGTSKQAGGFTANPPSNLGVEGSGGSGGAVSSAKSNSGGAQGALASVGKEGGSTGSASAAGGAKAESGQVGMESAGGPASPTPTAQGGAGKNQDTGVIKPDSNIQAVKDFVANKPGQQKTSEQISDFSKGLQSPGTNAVPESAKNAHDPHPSSGLQTPDSGKKAGIGDGTAPKPQNSNQSASAGSKKSGMDYLSELNRHVAQEKSSVSVSINTHHSD